MHHIDLSRIELQNSFGVCIVFLLSGFDEHGGQIR